MDLLHIFADVLSIILALIAFPSFSDILRVGTHIDRAPLNIEIQPPTPSGDTPMPSPMPSPMPAMVSRPTHGHKRKSVSFSLSSMDQVMASAKVTDKRPPTPWVARRAPSPSDDEDEDMVELPKTPFRRHSDDVVDPMGVKKSWLRGGEMPA
jgi:hypothetical protein